MVMENQAHGRSSFRNDHVIDIQHVHEEDVAAEDRHEFRALFYVRPEECQEGQAKVHEDEHDAQDVPVLGISEKEVTSLLGDVGIPDQEKLREGNVSPENGEGKAELTHNVVVLLSDDLLQVAHLLQKNSGQDKNSHRVEGGPREDIDSEHRREP